MRTIDEISLRISEIKSELLKIDDFRIGSLSKQWNVCGNPKCKCKDKEDPKKHGPYNKLSYTWKGKSKTEFIKDRDVDTVKEMLSGYKCFKQLTDEWVGLCLEIAKAKKNEAL
jgi:hypothetical protein